MPSPITPGAFPTNHLDKGYEAAVQLLDTGYSEIPDPRDLGQDVVERRVNQYVDDVGLDPYWDGEENELHKLMAMHNGHA